MWKSSHQKYHRLNTIDAHSVSEMYQDAQKSIAGAEISSPESASLPEIQEKKSLKQRIREIVWDSLDLSPEERRLIFKLDMFIL
jgi:ACS family pantothenate transporter-like MFS transporter